LQLNNLRSREIVNGLLDGSLDLGLVRSSAIDQSLVKKQRLKVEKLCRLDYAFYVRRELLKCYGGKLDDDGSLIDWCVENLALATFWGEMSVFTEALGKTKLGWPAQLRCESFPQVREAVVVGNYCGILPLVAFRDGVPENIYCFGAQRLASAGREVSLVWSSALTQRRAGGEKALIELRTALKSICAPLSRSQVIQKL